MLHRQGDIHRWFHLGNVGFYNTSIHIRDGDQVLNASKMTREQFIEWAIVDFEYFIDKVEREFFGRSDVLIRVLGKTWKRDLLIEYLGDTPLAQTAKNITEEESSDIDRLITIFRQALVKFSNDLEFGSGVPVIIPEQNPLLSDIFAQEYLPQYFLVPDPVVPLTKQLDTLSPQDQYIANGNFEAVAEDYDKIGRTLPDDPRNLYNLIVSLLVVNRDEEARKIFDDHRSELVELEKSIRSEVRADFEEATIALPDWSIILIGGPSGAGKSEMALRLSNLLRGQSRNIQRVHIDNYHVPQALAPRFQDQVDHENPETYNSDTVLRDVKLLLDGKQVNPPLDLHDPVASKSPIKLGEHDILTIDGLHALDKRYAEGLPADRRILKIFVDAPWQFRFMRRLIRDTEQFGFTPLKVLKMWVRVLEAEAIFVYPTQQYADFVVETGSRDELLSLASKTEQIRRNLEQDQEVLQSPKLLKILEDVRHYITNTRSEVRSTEEWTADIIRLLDARQFQRIAHPEKAGGTHFTTFLYPELSLVEQIPHSEKVMKSVRLAQERLGGLTVGFVVADDQGRRRILKDSLPSLRTVLDEKVRLGILDEANDLLRKFFEVTLNIIKRGVVNWDSKIENYGVTPTGEVVLIDLGGLEESDSVLEEPDTEDSSIFYFLSKMNEGIPVELKSSFSQVKEKFGFEHGGTVVEVIRKNANTVASQSVAWKPNLPPSRAEVRESPTAVLPIFYAYPSFDSLQGRFTVFADLNDVAHLTDEQLTQDYEKIALRHKNVSFVFYDDQKVIRSEVRNRLEKLQEQLGSHRIQITQDNAQSVFTRQWVGELIHVSKARKRGQAWSPMPVPFLKGLHRFRYLGDETGVVPVALLYVNQGNKGFENQIIDLSMVDQRLLLEVLAYQASLVFARSA